MLELCQLRVRKMSLIAITLLRFKLLFSVLGGI